MEKTAVEWLVDMLVQECGLDDEGDMAIHVINLAKQMEKELIMAAREDGHLSTYAEYGSTPKCYLDGGHEQYYNETFKSE